MGNRHVIRPAPPKAAALLQHPRFRVPTLPYVSDEREFLAGAQWALESAAAFVSPPKEAGEDDEFACDDVARALKGQLWDSLRALVSGRDA